MNITLNAEQTRLLADVVKSGAARSAEEAVDQALRALHAHARSTGRLHAKAGNLADLFATSPFHGLELSFDRDRDTGREIAL
jgi:hypothetical protein